MSNQQKFLVTGATGYTAGYVIPELLKRGAQVRGLVHKIDERSKKLEEQCVEIVQGDINDLFYLSDPYSRDTYQYELPDIGCKGTRRTQHCKYVTDFYTPRGKK